MSMASSTDGRPLPRITPVARPFFDAAAAGRLDLPRCPRDGFFYYPRTRCPRCLRDDWGWETVSGRGRVFSFTVDRVGHDPAQRGRLPLVVAVIELDEGPRMTANVLECDPADVRVGLRVEATFEAVDGVTLVQFRPAGEQD